MAKDWQCYFKRVPDKLTVGDTLNLLCDGQTKLELKEPIKIEFLDRKDDYSLVVLETLKKEDYFLALKVVPYKTGLFDKKFYITDGQNKIQIDNLSFEIQSVLTKKETKAYGPYGPFRLKPDFWYTFSISLSFIVIAYFILLFTFRFFKRRKFLKSILKRGNHLKASKFFVVNLRREQKDLIHSIKYLDKIFKTFLEDSLFIPALNKTDKQIMKNLKKYHPTLYKKEGRNIYQFLSEMSGFNKDKLSTKIYFDLKKFCQKLVFLIDENKDLK